MTTKTTFGLNAKAKHSYLKLIQIFPLASIQSEEHLAATLQVLDNVSSREGLDDGEEMYLDALSDLVGAYEDIHHPIEPSSDANMLRHLMEAKGMSQADLHRETGLPKSTISEVLSSRKPFSRKMIRELASFFKVDVSILAANL